MLKIGPHALNACFARQRSFAGVIGHLSASIPPCHILGSWDYSIKKSFGKQHFIKVENSEYKGRLASPSTRRQTAPGRARTRQYFVLS